MICAHRTDEPAFFTPCVTVCGGKCPCAEDLRAEEKAAKMAQACEVAASRPDRRQMTPNDTVGVTGRNGTIQSEEDQ